MPTVAKCKVRFDFRDQREKKSRRSAFIAAGIAGVICLGGVVASGFILKNRILNPHTLHLPSLDLSIAIPAMTEKEKSSAPNASIVLQDAPLEPLSDAATPHQEQVMDTSASSINAAHESDSAPNPAPKPMEMQIFGSEGTLRPDIADTPSQIPTGQASIETIPQQTPPVMAKQLDPEQLARCALAFRISGEATRLASLSGDDNQDTRARAFQVKFLSACSGLSISINDLQDAAAKIPDEDVNKLAESILAGS